MKTQFILALVSAALAPLIWAQSPADNGESPGAAAQTMLATIHQSTETLLGSYEPLGANGDTLVGWLGDESPKGSCDLNAWSTAAAVGQMPIVWNAKRHLYEIDRKSWYSASPAIQRFTYFYLRAYAGLAESQRAAHSTLAIGIAGVIAAETVYPENWAVLPDNVAGPSEIVAALEATSHGFIVKARTADAAAATELARGAMQSLAAVGGAYQLDDALQHPEKLTEVSWEQVGGEGLSLDAFIPSHPESQQRLQEQAYAIHNLTLRMGVIASISKVRLSFLPEGSQPESPWKTVSAKEISALREEMKARGVETVAPSGVTGTGAGLLKADPGVLRPLAVMMIAPLGQQLLEAYQAKGPEGCKAVLSASKEFSDLCGIAGQRPELILAAKPKVMGESVFMGKMLFRNMLRVQPDPGKVASPEEVAVDLVAIIPRGDGQPIMGFDARAFVFAKLPNEAEPRWMPAHDIVAGCKVLGHRPLGDPATGATCDLKNGTQEEFFTVTDIRIVDDVKGTIQIDVGKEKVAVAIPQSVLMYAAGTGIWVQARFLDPQCYSWAGPVASSVDLEKCKFGAITETVEPQRLVQLFLTHEQDDLAEYANNCVISMDPTGATSRLTTECSSGDISFVDELEEVQTADGKTALHAVTANEKCDPNSNATVVKPYWQRPEECDWKYPSFTPGEAWVTRKVDTRPLSAIKLCVSESKGGPVRDFLCSKNTKLLALDRQGKPTLRRARNAKPGEKLVKTFGADGETPVTVDVVSAEEVVLPTQKFVGMQLTNLKYAQTGPLMVEWQAAPWHLFNFGVSPESRLATCVSDGGEGPKPGPGGNPGEDARAASGYRVHGSVAAKESGKEDLAAFDPAYSCITRTSLSGAQRPTTITRMLEVTCGQSRLTVASSQAFLIKGRPGGPDVDIVLAYQLMKGDQVFVAHDGDRTAAPAAVDNVMPVFRVRSPVQELRAKSAVSWHGKLPLRSDLCIGESMAMAMAVPMTVPLDTNRYTMNAPGTSQAGPACGTAKGKNGGKSSVVDQSGGGGIPVPPPPPVDCLDIPQDAVEQFTHRANMIKIQFEGEKGKIQSVAKGGILARFDASLNPGPWPFGEAGDQLSDTLENWLKGHLEIRAKYLKHPTYSETPSICLADLTLAAWLKAAGCPETARLMGRNAVELSIIAGCSPKAVHRPDLASRMGLGLVLAAEDWITPADQATRENYPVTPSTSRQVSTWAENLKVSTPLLDTSVPIEPPVPAQGRIQLNELFTIWSILGKSDNIDWPDFSNADSDVSKSLAEWLTTHRPDGSTPGEAASNEAPEP